MFQNKNAKIRASKSLKYPRLDLEFSRKLLLLALLVALAFVTPMIASAQEYTLTINIVGHGTVDTDPDGPYLSGTEVQLTAIPDTDWVFDGWSDDLSGTDNPETIVMTSDKTVTATFSTTSPTQLIQELVEKVEENRDSGEIDNNGIANSLIAKLDAAKAQLEAGNTKAAANILRAFINHVEAQHGKKNKHITETAAHELIEDTELILSQL